MSVVSIEQDAAGQRAVDSVWGPAYRRLTVGLLLVVSGVAFEALAVATSLPLTVEELGGLSLYGWAFSAFMLTNLVGITLSGSAADRRGPGWPLFLGVVFFTIGLLLAGAAPTMPVLILGRAVQGIGAGFVSTTAYVVIGRAYADAVRARMLALLASAWVIPGLVGPAIAGLVAEYVGWRWVFLALVPLLPLAAWLVLPGLRQFAKSSEAPQDWSQIVGAARVAGGSGLALAGLTAPSPWFAAALIGAGALLAIPSLRALLPAGTFRAAPGLPAVIAMMGLLHLGFFGADAFVPLTLTALREQSVAAAGVALTSATVFWTVGAWLQARLADRASRRLVVVAGLVLLVLGVAGFAAVLLPTVPVWIGAIAWGVAGLGIGLAFSTGSLVVLETAPNGEEGVASAAMQLAGGLGIALGAGVGGALVARAEAGGALQAGLGAQFLLMIVVLGLALLAATRLPDAPPSRLN